MADRRIPSGYPEYLEAFRRLLDVAAEAAPDDAALPALTEALDAVSDLFVEYRVPEEKRLFGQFPSLPGRGSPAMVDYITLACSATELTATARFRAINLGGNGAAHGGTVAMMFGEIMGEVANAAGRPRARTAYLTVNYRVIVRLLTDLRAHVMLDRIEGRKRFVTATLSDGERVVADAKGLWVELRSGQP